MSVYRLDQPMGQFYCSRSEVGQLSSQVTLLMWCDDRGVCIGAVWLKLA